MPRGSPFKKVYQKKKKKKYVQRPVGSGPGQARPEQASSDNKTFHVAQYYLASNINVISDSISRWGLTKSQLIYFALLNDRHLWRNEQILI